MEAESQAGQARLIQIQPRPGTVQISRGRTVFVSDGEGSVTKDHPMEGLYVYQTRVLRGYGWRMNAKKPEFSCGSNIDQFCWIGYYVQAPKDCDASRSEDCDPLQQTIELRLTRSVGEGMHEDVQLTNHTQTTSAVRLQLQFQHAFESLDEAEGGRQQHGRMESHWSRPARELWELRTDYWAEHHYRHQGTAGEAKLHRALKLRVENAGSRPSYRSGRLSFNVKLRPHETWHACLSWFGYENEEFLPLSTGCSRVASGDWRERRSQFLARAASVSVPRAAEMTATAARVISRAVFDLADLRLYDLDTPGGVAIAAGVPTYVGIFGRDLLASSWEAALLGPELIRGSLDVLARFQASRQDDWRDAQPGRIAHEVHTDPLSQLNFRPKSLYFGSVSSSFLYPALLSELWHWTGDPELVRRYIGTTLDAIRWADKYSLDSTGFYRYQTRSEQGMKNQGWKDSSDAIVYPDGSQVEAPIGTCEMQGFVYAAKLALSEVLWWLGETDFARRLYTEAEDLKSRFNEKFWLDDEGYLAMGIDARGDLIRSIASDAGHCLLCGIIDQARAQQVATRLLADDMFSGWGVRTLSSQHPAYNPFSYHRGSVWPVENAAFVAAFSRRGMHEQMWQLARAVFEAATLFPFERLPEVFGGHPRDFETPFPGLYTRADWPQAWSASAPLAVLQALVGLCPYAPAGVLLLDPRLPEWLPEITIERLRVGKGTVTLRLFRNSRGDSDYEVLRLDGRLNVIRQANPWSTTQGWAEHVKEAVMELSSLAGLP